MPSRYHADSRWTRESCGSPIPSRDTACLSDRYLVSRQTLVDQWFNATYGAGQLHLKLEFKPRQETLSIEQFELLKVIGKGSFGKVMQVKKKDTQRIYALKTIRKAHIASRPGEITHILAERTVLALVNNPFIVPLKFSFQNPDKLYLVMSFGKPRIESWESQRSLTSISAVNGGELFYHLQREGKFDETRSRFYAAELLSALEHLHYFNVIYRWVRRPFQQHCANLHLVVAILSRRTSCSIIPVTLRCVISVCAN